MHEWRHSMIAHKLPLENCVLWLWLLHQYWRQNPFIWQGLYRGFTLQLLELSCPATMLWLSMPHDHAMALHAACTATSLSWYGLGTPKSPWLKIIMWFSCACMHRDFSTEETYNKDPVSKDVWCYIRSASCFVFSNVYHIPTRIYWIFIPLAF